MPVPSNDPLALQLNDLALANSEGLLNDDEYRLLRQNLFERFENSVFPTATFNLGPNVVSRSAGGIEILSVTSSTLGKHASAPRRKHVQVIEQPTPRAPAAPSLTPSRSKISGGVAGLLRRATGRSKSASPAPVSSPTPIKLNLIPRMFSKKPDDAFSSDTDTSSTRHSSSRSFSRSGSSVDLSRPRTKPKSLGSPIASSTRHKVDPTPPSSPFRANFDAVPKSPSRSAFATGSTSSSKYDVIPGASNDVFDDDNLSSAKAIRKAIADVEAEGRRLVAAFNDLETSAVIRYRREHPQRQRSGPIPSSSAVPRPPALNSLRVPPVPSSSGSHTPSRSRSNSFRTADAQSIRSNSSLRTAKSIGSFLHGSSSTPPPPPLPPAFLQSPPPPQASSPSAWSARLPSLRRKGSASSINSQSTLPANSLLTPPRPSLTLKRSASTSIMSRSTGHLPLPTQTPTQRHAGGSTIMELLSAPEPSPDEGGEELAEVRRRRGEMVGRCDARLEYLRAKLKAQELHEKLLRK